MDEITVEILPDGRIKTTTGQVSSGNHRSADDFLKLVNELMGGPVEEEKIARGRVGAHEREGRYARGRR